MSDSSTEITISRILVALDASAYGRAALEAAAELAAELHAELKGLFVEDENLLRLAGLPFAREVAYSSAVPRPMDVAAVERSLRAKAEEVRRAFSTTAQRIQVQWSFDVVRGHIIRTTLDTARDVDLLFIGCAHAPRPSQSRSAHTHAAASPIVAVYDGTASGRRALFAAARLAREYADTIVLLVFAPEAAAAPSLKNQALAILLEQRGTLLVQPTVISSVSGLLVAARRLNVKLLLLNRDSKLLDEVTVESLVNAIDCPVVLVR